MPLVGNLYPKGGNRPKRVEIPDNVKGKKEKQLKAIWGYLSPRIEYLKDIPKNIFDKGISAISYTEEFKEEFDKNPKDTLKHIIDKLNSELNSILHEYDFN